MARERGVSLQKFFVELAIWISKVDTFTTIANTSFKRACPEMTEAITSRL